MDKISGPVLNSALNVKIQFYLTFDVIDHRFVRSEENFADSCTKSFLPNEVQLFGKVDPHDAEQHSGFKGGLIKAICLVVF